MGFGTVVLGSSPIDHIAITLGKLSFLSLYSVI